ncbi:hypothetical protein E4U55_001508 [Claviceps digitariae]|nr:hypothetical protein E4U55_001508 [Claviceps digitariae]
MFFDTAHNSKNTALESLHHAFHETARKMVAYIRCLAKARRPRPSLVIALLLNIKPPNHSSSTETIRQVSHVAYSILTSKSRRLRHPDYVCAIRSEQVTSVAHAAFLQVLVQYQSNYRVVIEWLRKQSPVLGSL